MSDSRKNANRNLEKRIEDGLKESERLKAKAKQLNIQETPAAGDINTLKKETKSLKEESDNTLVSFISRGERLEDLKEKSENVALLSSYSFQRGEPKKSKSSFFRFLFGFFCCGKKPADSSKEEKNSLLIP